MNDFKELDYPREEQAQNKYMDHWYVYTQDGSALLLNDKSHKTQGGAKITAKLMYFETELKALVAMWDYYNTHNRDFAVSLKGRWYKLYYEARGAKSAKPLINESQHMIFQ